MFLEIQIFAFRDRLRISPRHMSSNFNNTDILFVLDSNIINTFELRVDDVKARSKRISKGQNLLRDDLNILSAFY